MTDIRKVICSYNAPIPLYNTTNGNPTGVLKVPEGDRPVMYDATGFLSLDKPLVYSGVSMNTNITNLASEQYNSLTNIVACGTGGYYDATLQPMLPQDLSPFRSIIAVAPSAAVSYYFPQPSTLCSWLRSVLGPENVLPGLSWCITFINNAMTSGHNITVFVPGPGINANTYYTCYGINNQGGTYTPPISWYVDILNAQNTAPVSNSSTYRFVLTNVSPGYEQISIFRTY